jgi:hypothetical protein
LWGAKNSVLLADRGFSRCAPSFGTPPAVWVTNPTANLVQKIDPRRNKVVRTIRVAGSPRFLAVGEGGVWTLNQLDGSITRIDPASGAVRATIQAAIKGAGGDITTGGGWVWARGARPWVHKLSRVPNPVDLRGDRISAPHRLVTPYWFRQRPRNTRALPSLVSR